MASVKIKFRVSAANGGQGTIFYQVIHNRVARQIRTGYRIYESEWDGNLSEIKLPPYDKERSLYLNKLKGYIQNDLYRLNKIITSLNLQGWQYSSDDVVSAFGTTIPQNTFFCFMEDVISNLKKLGKARTAESYISSLSSFRKFRNGDDVMLNNMDSDMMLAYEAYLRDRGVKANSSSFYMRSLRAVYNRAVDKELTVQRFPFRHVYTGVDKTVKRAVPLKTVRKLRDLDLSYSPSLDFARNMFMFSFYTRGMSFVDMAFLRKRDLSGGILSYRRHKTGQQLFIKWEKCMQDIVEKYAVSESSYLLPVIRKSGDNERRQYIYAGHNINRSLKIIGRRLGLSMPLTMYVARHTWASIAKSKKVPLSVISEGMGHDSEKTTRIYLASLDNMEIDKANSMILKML